MSNCCNSRWRSSPEPDGGGDLLEAAANTLLLACEEDPEYPYVVYERDRRAECPLPAEPSGASSRVSVVVGGLGDLLDFAQGLGIEPEVATAWAFRAAGVERHVVARVIGRDPTVVDRRVRQAQAVVSASWLAAWLER
jgi:hypothetical protein